MKNILDQISSHYPKLKPSQKKVASCLHNNINEAFLLNSFQIAKKANVSLIASTKIPTYIESYAAPMSLINTLITSIALRKKIRLYLPLINLKTPLRNSRRIFREQFLDTKRKEVRSLIFSCQRIT